MAKISLWCVGNVSSCSLNEITFTNQARLLCGRNNAATSKVTSPKSKMFPRKHFLVQITSLDPNSRVSKGCHLQNVATLSLLRFLCMCVSVHLLRKMYNSRAEAKNKKITTSLYLKMLEKKLRQSVARPTLTVLQP